MRFWLASLWDFHVAGEASSVLRHRVELYSLGDLLLSWAGGYIGLASTRIIDERILNALWLWPPTQSVPEKDGGIMLHYTY